MFIFDLVEYYLVIVGCSRLEGSIDIERMDLVRGVMLWNGVVDHELVGCIFVKVEQLCGTFVSFTIVLPSNLGRGEVWSTTMVSISNIICSCLKNNNLSGPKCLSH